MLNYKIYKNLVNNIKIIAIWFKFHKMVTQPNYTEISTNDVSFTTKTQRDAIIVVTSK